MKGSLSPSALSKFKDCPRCFWLSKNKVKPFRGIMASIPNGIDAILKDYHDEHRVRGEIPPEIAAQIPGVRPFKDLIKLNRWRTLGQGISGEIDGIPVMGLLDDLLEFEDGTVSSYDYKSNRSPRTPDYVERFYQHQGDIYNALLEHNGFKVRWKSYFSFWSPKEITESGNAETKTTQFPFDCTIHVIDSSLKRIKDLLKRAAACLDGDLPEPGDDCEMCTYVKRRALKMQDIHRERKEAAAAAEAAEAAKPTGATESAAA